MRESDVIALLAKRYQPPVWAFLPQLRNGTGYAKAARTADAIAMALWPSRGLEIVGFEVKVSRADWLRELRDAEKAEEFFAVCDRWYVAAPDDVVRADEVPPGWGWLAPLPSALSAAASAIAKGAVKVMVEATRREGKDPDRLLLAAILRRVQESTVPRDSIQAELEAARKRGQKDAEATAAYSAEKHENLKAKVAEFEKVSGVKIADYWGGGSVGRAVRQVLEHGPEHIRSSIEAHRRWLEGLLRDCDEQLAEKDPGLAQAALTEVPPADIS